MPSIDIFEPLPNRTPPAQGPERWYIKKRGFALSTSTGGRDTVDVDGQRVSGGAQTFEVAGRPVDLGWGIGWGGQLFDVVGIRQLDDYGARFEVETTQRDEAFPTMRTVTAEGDPVTVDGERLLVGDPERDWARPFSKPLIDGPPVDAERNA